MQVLQTEELGILFEKTESIIKEIHNNRQLLISIKTFDDFSLHKIKFTQFFFDIEDELRESLQNARNSYIKIKELKDQLELFKQRYQILENKYSNSENYIRELKSNVKECLEQIKFQESFQLKNANYITELEEKIKILELESKIHKVDNSDQKIVSLKMATNENLNDDLSYKNLNMKEKISNNLDNQPNIRSLLIKSTRNEILENVENKKIEFLINPSSYNLEDKGINFARINVDENNEEINNIIIKENKIKDDITYIKNNDIVEESFDSSTNYKIKEKHNYSQYNDIITERENSKKLINDYIKDSLIFNYNKNINNIASKNDIPRNLNIKSSNNLNASNNLNSDEKIITFGREEENIFNLYNQYYSNNNKIINNNYYEIANDFKKKDITLIDNPKNSISKIQINSNNKEKSKIKYKTKEIPIQEEKLEQIDKEFNEKNLGKEDNFVLKNKIPDINNIIDKNKNDSDVNVLLCLDTKKRHNNIQNNIDCNSFSNEKNIQNIYNDNSISPNQSTRADKILEVVVKIRTIEDVSSIIYHLFGEDILDKIISPNVDFELVEKIDATIKEIERLMENEDYNETEPLQDPPKKIDIKHPSVIKEKEEESIFINKILPHKEDSYTNPNNPQEYPKKPHNFFNIISNKNISKDFEYQDSKIKQINVDLKNNNNEDNGKNSVNNTNFTNKKKYEEEYLSTPSLQTPSNLHLNTINEVESNYSKNLKSGNNNMFINSNHNTLINPSLYQDNHCGNNYNDILYLNSNNVNSNGNINYKNAQINIYSNNSNDITKTSYDILSENNLRISGSKFKGVKSSANRSFSKPNKNIYSSDSAAASKINFERSLRNYDETNNEIGGNNGYSRLNTSGNIRNKKIFNNYPKNKGILFDNTLFKNYDAQIEKRKKSNSKGKNKINYNNENSIDIKSIREMQKFQELYHKFKHLTVQWENTNIDAPNPYRGYIKRGSNEIKNLQKEQRINEININENKPQKYIFNDD